MIVDVKSRNLVVLVGRVDGEPKYLKNKQVEFYEFRLLTERGSFHPDAEGNQQYQGVPEFHQIRTQYYHVQACERLKDGDLVYADGFIHYEGEKAIIICNTLVPLERTEIN